MFERSRTVRSLYALARERAQARSIRIPVSFGPLFRGFGVAVFRLVFCFVIGVYCAYLPPEHVFALMGVLGVLILLFQWHNVARALSRPPAFFSLYPASAERILASRFRLFLHSALWLGAGSFSIIVALALGCQILVSSAVASIPLGLAFAVWMIVLPLLLEICVPSPLPRSFASLALIFGCVPLLMGRNAPVLFSACVRSLAALSWFVPAGWFYHLTSATLDPALKLMFGIAALGTGAALIKPLFSILERRVIRGEENADISDASISSFGAVADDSDDEPDWLSQPEVAPVCEARAILDGTHWGVLLEPRTALEKVFWRTLNARQKSVSRMIWPLGLDWNFLHFAFFKIAASCIALAGFLRLLSFTNLAWGTLALGSISLFIFAPILPAYDFIFQSLPVGGRRAARCQFFPVTVSEISKILHRCQAIRTVGASWIGAAYGAAAWFVMGRGMLIGAFAGLFLILAGFSFCPFAMIWQLTHMTDNGGRRWTSIPNVLLAVLTILLSLIFILTVILAHVILAVDPPKPVSSIPFMLGGVLVWRLAGTAILNIYLFMVERSWLDAVVKVPKQR